MLYATQDRGHGDYDVAEMTGKHLPYRIDCGRYGDGEIWIENGVVHVKHKSDWVGDRLYTHATLSLEHVQDVLFHPVTLDRIADFVLDRGHRTHSGPYVR